MSSPIPKVGQRVEFASRFVPRSSNLLDIGCGDGYIVNFVREKVSDIYGIDIEEISLKRSRLKGIITKKCDLDKESLPFRRCFFEVITCLDVIEHVRNPLLLLKNIHRVLKKRGILIISTPNIRYSNHLYRLIFEGVFPKTSEDYRIYDGGHIHFFTYKDLNNLLLESRFKILKIEGIINKETRGWKGRFIQSIVGKKIMNEFRSPGILLIAQKI